MFLPSCVFAHIIGAQQSKDLHWECHIAILHNVWHFLLQRCKGVFCWGRKRQVFWSQNWAVRDGTQKEKGETRKNTGKVLDIHKKNIIHSSPNDFEGLGGSYSLAFHAFVSWNTLFTSPLAPATTVWFLIINNNMIYIYRYCIYI